MRQRSHFGKLKRIFKTLHGPKGCMWDKKQTHESIIPDLKEEVGEFIAAVRKKNPAHMREELGDILLHVMFHAQMASKQGDFDIEDVVKGLSEKLVRRHPHVFGKEKVTSTRQIIRNWEKIKLQEKAGQLRKKG